MSPQSPPRHFNVMASPPLYVHKLWGGGSLPRVRLTRITIIHDTGRLYEFNATVTLPKAEFETDFLPFATRVLEHTATVMALHHLGTKSNY
jgi:hypothetical protein